MKKIITPKSWGNNSVPLKQFQGYTIILESGETIVYPHTNQYPTLFNPIKNHHFHAETPLNHHFPCLRLVKLP